MDNKKIKILAISDDIRIRSGVGIQCKKILTGLQKTGKFECIELGGSTMKGDINPIMVDGIKVYPSGGFSYGNAELVRLLLQIERPDIVLAFSDPRFFMYLFEMDDEVRQFSKLVYYHTWDNDPFPKYNLPYYSSCDELIMISEFSYNLFKDRVKCRHIPHMQNFSEFYPLPEEEVKKELDNLKKLVGLPNADFVIFFNNRNLDRKRPGDVVNIFEKFNKKYKNSILLMNTHASDPEGTDLIQLQQEYLERDVPVVFNFSTLPTDKLNLFYNVADVTINISYNEGFGLCVSESLLAGTPVVITDTGGMPEQMSHVEHVEARNFGTIGSPVHDREVQYGIKIAPAVRNLFGVPGAAYIYRDFVSDEAVINALENMYFMKKQGELKKLGLSGREYVIKKYDEATIVKQWEDTLTEIYSSPSTYEKISIKTI